MKDFLININIKVSSRGLKKEHYDVIIIGAGIGGLVCGCYLAKAGMKVLIVEKNLQAGGCCTSFNIGKYHFDAGVHGIGGVHKNGKVANLIEDLSLPIDFVEKEPAESIYFGNKYLINFWNDLERTKADLFQYFPKEKDNIIKFINFVLTLPPVELFFRYRKFSFSELLDNFFYDENLKTIFKIPGGNIGIESAYSSALSMLMLYREFLLNPSKYPKKGGVGSLPGVLKEKFESLGGSILFSNEVTEVSYVRSLYAVLTKMNSRLFFGKKIVFNIAPMQIVDIAKNIKEINKLKQVIKKLIVSPSAYFINFGLKYEKELLVKGIQLYNLWFFPYDDTSRVFLGEEYKAFQKQYISSNSVFISFPSKNSCRILILAPFISKDYWGRNKDVVFSNLLKRAKPLLGNIEKMSESIVISTPLDLYRFTYNYQGACYGCVATKTMDFSGFSFLTLNKDLLLCGHWVPNIFGSSGISSVVNSGIACSQFILRQKNK